MIRYDTIGGIIISHVIIHNKRTCAVNSLIFSSSCADFRLLREAALRPCKSSDDDNCERSEPVECFFLSVLYKNNLSTSICTGL